MVPTRLWAQLGKLLLLLVLLHLMGFHVLIQGAKGGVLMLEHAMWGGALLAVGQVGWAKRVLGMLVAMVMG